MASQIIYLKYINTIYLTKCWLANFLGVCKYIEVMWWQFSIHGSLQLCFMI